jgi:CubicO group peptidase (beta-lactamase class C family)
LKLYLILLIILFAAFSSEADDDNYYDNLAPTDKIKVDSLVEKMSFSEKIDQLFWFQAASTGDEQRFVGGQVSPSPNLFSKADRNELVYRILDITNGFDDPTTARLRFPNQITRKAARADSYNQLNQLYSFDFWLDLPIIEQTPVYYGVFLTEAQAKLVPFYTTDSLFQNLLYFDQVLWLTTTYHLDSLIQKDNFKRKQIRLLRRKVKNVLSMKFLLKKNRREYRTPEVIDWLNYEKWKWNVYAGSITLQQNSNVLPLKNLGASTTCTYTFQPKLFSTFDRVTGYYGPIIGYQANQNYSSDLVRLKDYDNVIIPIASWTREKVDFINKLNKLTKIIVVDFNPQEIRNELSSNISHVMVWEMNEITLTLAPQSLFGAYSISGGYPFSDTTFTTSSTRDISRLRYTPPVVARMDVGVLEKIDAIVEEAIEIQAFPGCQILIARDGQVLFQKNYGYYTYDSLIPVQDYSLYDLASLTKVLATTQAVMFLEERGLIDLDKSIGHYLSELQGSNKEHMVIREIMTHQAGLFPYLPFWMQILPGNENSQALIDQPIQNYFQISRGLYLNKAMSDSIMSWSIDSDLIEKEDEAMPYEYKYSDIGYYLLKTLVERIINQPMDDFLDQNLYGPMGMGICFAPLCRYPEAALIPTETDMVFRKELVRGFVHDRNATLFGGVSGHAGLFGNANDIAKLLQMHLQKGIYGGKQYFFPETIERFTGKQYVNNRRGLGWDKPGPEPDGPVSLLASTDTFGHTGFTGTAIWADPQENLIFIFLSNRVYPSSDNLKLVELNIRTRIQDLAYGAIIIDQ